MKFQIIEFYHFCWEKISIGKILSDKRRNTQKSYTQSIQNSRVNTSLCAVCSARSHHRSWYSPHGAEPTKFQTRIYICTEYWKVVRERDLFCFPGQRRNLFVLFSSIDLVYRYIDFGFVSISALFCESKEFQVEFESRDQRKIPTKVIFNDFIDFEWIGHLS